MRPVRPIITCLTVALALGAAATPARAERFECLVEPFLEVNLASGIPGLLGEVLVERGDSVTGNQVLARLRSDVERANLDLVRARAAFAARRVERNEEMYRKQMISIHEKDEIETQSELLKLEVKEVEERLKLRTIRSPIDGVVVKLFYSPGEFVQEETILSIAQINPLRVEVVVPVRLYGRVKVGMKAKVEWEAPLGHVRTATVTVVDPVVDAASGTVGIRLELPNPKKDRLPAGTKCWVEFPDGEAGNSAGG